MGRSLLLVVVPLLMLVSENEAIMKIEDLGPKVADLIETLRGICVPRTGVQADAIDRVANGDFTRDPTIVAYMKCLFIESGVADENGDLIMDVITELMPPKMEVEGMKNLKICDAKRKSIKDIDDRIFAFFKCVYDQNPDLFIFF